MTRAGPVLLPPRGLARVTSWLAARHSLRSEFVLVLGLYGLSKATRGLVAGSRSLAIRHADDVVSIERSLHLYFEASVQRSSEQVLGLTTALGVAYLTLHLAVTGLLLIWLHQRRPKAYPFARTTLLLASGLAVIGYLSFPTAPPRLSGLRILDTVSGHLPVTLDNGLVSGLYNPYAAVPSVHVAYALIVGAVLLRQGHHLITRVSGVAYPVFVVFVIVATGNHFFLDAGAGALAAMLAAATAALMLRRPATEPIVLPSRRTAAVLDQRAA
jgi:hypothetical protein